MAYIGGRACDPVYHSRWTTQTGTASAIDIALTAAASDFDIHVQDLFRERFVCGLRDGHPAAKVPWSPELFCSLDHALTALDGNLEGLTDHVLAESGLKRRVVLSVASFLVLPTLIRSTNIVAVVPARLNANLPSVILRAPPVVMPGFVLSGVWHERTHLDGAKAWARSILVEVCASLGTKGIGLAAGDGEDIRGHP